MSELEKRLKEEASLTNLNIAIDFDGTIVEHMFPKIGDPVPGAIRVIKKLQKAGHRIILFTMRSGEYLEEATKYLFDNGVYLYGENTNPTQSKWTDSPKAYAHIYIDDAALGCPLEIAGKYNRPQVNWEEVEELLIARGVLVNG